MNFHSLYTYETVFTKTYPQGIVICILYVDDCLLTVSSDEIIFQAYSEIRLSGIELEKYGDLNHFLGIHYKRTGKNTMTLYRPPSPAIGKLASTAKPATSSLQQYFTKELLEQSPAYQFPIRSIVGDVNYTALPVRPDLTYATSYLTQFLNHQNMATWKFTKQLQNYLPHIVR